MFKFLLFGIFLWQHLLCEVSGERYAVDKETDTPPPNWLGNVRPKSDHTSRQLTLEPDARYSFHAAHQTFYLNGNLVPSDKQDCNCHDNEPNKNSCSDHKTIRSDYNVSKGIGAHKLHLHSRSWNMARRTCHEEGGHLAIIRSHEENEIIKKIMKDAKIDAAWIGFHDIFQEGDWITVLDEPLGEIEWSAWARNMGHANPDNANGIENCGQYRTEFEGINDFPCDRKLPFVCKISIS